LTGKLAQRPPALVALKRDAGLHALAILDAQLADRDFVAGETCTIADISVFAYASVAADAGYDLAPHANLRAWIGRVRAQAGFLDEVHPYAIDPHSTRELPRAFPPEHAPRRGSPDA
jgi:glutathione S-transferase